MSNYDTQLALLNPEGHWALDLPAAATVAPDSSGNGFDATLQSGTPTYGVSGPVIYQSAIQNNSSEWLTTLRPDNTWDALTVIAWIKAPWGSSGGANPRIVAAGHTDSDGTGFQLGFFSDLTFDVGGKSSLSFNSTGWDATAWHMLCGTYDGSDGAAALYLDGVAKATATWATGALVTPSVNLGFGYNSAYNGDAWSDDLGEIAVLKTALSQAQVAALVTAAQRDYPAWIGEAGWL